MFIASFFYKNYRGTAIKIGLLTLISGFFESLSFLSLLPIVDIIINNGNPDSQIAATIFSTIKSFNFDVSLGLLLLAMVLTLIFKEVIRSYTLILAGYTTARVASDYRTALVKNIFNADWSFINRLRVGAMANSITTETHRASSLFMYFVKTYMYTLQIIIYLTLAVFISIEVTSLAIFTGLLMFVSLNFLIKISGKAGEEQTNSFTLLVSSFTDFMGSMKVFKAMGVASLASQKTIKEIENINCSLRKSTFSSVTLSFFQEMIPIIILIIALYLSVTILGVSFSSFVVASALFMSLIRRVTSLQKQLNGAANQESTFTSVYKNINKARQNEELNIGKKKFSIRKQIVFEDVLFKYAKLKKVNITIPVNKLTVLTGKSGIGKTSIVDALVGLSEIDSGNIYFDDYEIKDIDIKKLRANIGYVGQDISLLNDTILNNITLFDDSISESLVKETLKKVDAYDFVMSLESGLSYMVGEKGGKLSGGQKQKICIARAIIRNPKLIIFDEITSSLDSESDYEISRLAKDLSKNSTVISIAHKGSMSNYADKLYLLTEDAVSII